MQGRIRQFFHFHHLNGLCGQQPWSAKNLQLLEQLPLDGPLRFCLDTYIEMLRCLLDCRKRLHLKLRELGKKPRYQSTFVCLSSAPGIGWLTAIRLVLEFGGDLSRFRSGRHFSSFLGLTGKERSTGDTVRRGHITRCGSAPVRSWLVESAWTAYKRDPVLANTFMRIYRRSRSKKIAIVAVARKLAVRLWHLTTTQQTYVLGMAQ
jgi:transposase